MKGQSGEIHPDGSGFQLYSEDVIVRGLQHLDHLAAVCESKPYCGRLSEMQSEPEEAWCLFIDLKAALKRLPVQQRRAVILNVVMGLPEEEAAARAGMGRRTLRDRVRAGLLNIKKSLNSQPTPTPFRGSNFPS